MNRITSCIENLNSNDLFEREWLITNGLGGYASGSICGAPMRKYHGLLIAALPAPFGRTVMLNFLEETLILPDSREIPLSIINKDARVSNVKIPLTQFRLDFGLPVWRYQFEEIIIEKSILLINKQNTLHLHYKLISSNGPVAIKCRPFLHFRTGEEAVSSKTAEIYEVLVQDHHYEIKSGPYPSLRFFCSQMPPFIIDSQIIENVFYEIEFKRGYEFQGRLTSPGFYLIQLNPGGVCTLVASTEPWRAIEALSPSDAWIAEKQRRMSILKTSGPIAKDNLVAKLTLGADQFIITPYSRYEDMIRLQAAGEEAKSIIAGYPWFTDWGRDTMISLEGLTLTTGRFNLASAILRTFAYYVKDGLIPNMFPDGENEGIYNTADATLWFFHAVDRYIQITNDTDILEFILPKLIEIVNCHIKGTRFGIHVDKDGLLIQGEQGVQLTWMDAKVGDWVVTPRRGKAVEINALWYNALKLLERWTGNPSELATLCYDSFNKRFWYEKGGYLYDVVDAENGGDDTSLRPNQLFAISLHYPVLEQSRWKPVLDTVTANLLTPLGLRTLSPEHPDFKKYYEGDLRARDAAYHQGTVWPWLIGPFIDVWLKVYPDDINGARKLLKGLEDHMNQNCLETLAEIFDSWEPYQARGCFAQAWSVAELLRSIVKVNGT